MADININTRSVESVNTQLPAIISRVAAINGVVLRMRSSIDSNVQSRGNIRTRLNNIQNEINSMEKELRDLHRTINEIVNIYEKNEMRQINRVKNLSSSLY
jgi:chromosome segregation ATPase